jgi:hypothetical protein
VPDEVDEELQLGVDNTSEAWKQALVVGAQDERRARTRWRKRERLILLVMSRRSPSRSRR